MVAAVEAEWTAHLGARDDGRPAGGAAPAARDHRPLGVRPPPRRLERNSAGPGGAAPRRDGRADPLRRRPPRRDPGREPAAAGAHHLRRAGRGRLRPRPPGPRPLPGRRAGRGALALADPRAARQRGQRRALGAGQDRDPRARGQEVAVGPPQRPVGGLHRAVHRQRLRDGLRLLLRAPAQGLRQPDHRVHQHRPDHRLPAPARRPAGRQARAEPVRPGSLGLRHRREQRLLGRRAGQRQRRATWSPPSGELPTAKASLRHQVRQPRAARPTTRGAAPASASR